MKKTTKKSPMMKIASAAAMLAVSASMLATSTYAWFSMNTTVTVQTMSISATAADPNIQISANGTNFYNTLHTDTVNGEAANWTLATNQPLTLVTPTAISSTNVVTWGWAQSTNPDNAQSTNDVTAVSDLDPIPTVGDRNGYLQGDVGTTLADKYFVFAQKLTIKNLSPTLAATNLKVTDVEINGGSNTIKNSVRLLFVSGGEYAVYQLDSAGTGTEAGECLKLVGATQMSGDDNNIVAASIAENGGTVDVDVYMFFDGTDADAKTTLASDLTGVTATFAFEIDEST